MTISTNIMVFNIVYLFAFFSGDYNNVLETFDYSSKLKVPLLSEALELLKGKRLLIYLEVSS